MDDKKLAEALTKIDTTLNRVVDLLEHTQKIKVGTVPEVDNSSKADYVIMKRGDKDKKGRFQPFNILIGGVQHTTGNKVELSEKELLRYGKGNFMKYDKAKFKEEKGKYILKS